MVHNLMFFTLKCWYKFLIVKITFVNKNSVADYEDLSTFCIFNLPTNHGPFNFVFRQQAPTKVRGYFFFKTSLVSYFVELVPPEAFVKGMDAFRGKVAAIVKIRIKRVNPEVLSSVLLDVYIDSFSTT